MSDSPRSKLKITKSDLQRLAEIARLDREDLFRRKPEVGRLYSRRVLIVALCQGAALHYIDGKNGIKDFDVWTFFESNSMRPFPYRRNKHRDFGDPRFGRTPGKRSFVGRSVDLIGRSIPLDEGQPGVQAVQSYLAEGRTKSARLLARKAVIVLEPTKLMGLVIWPEK